MNRYDMLIIGSGPGGQKAAIQAAKLGKKVAVIERNSYVGGSTLHTGTLPSKTLRETALYLSGFRQRAVAAQFSLGKDMTLSELMHRKLEVTRKQMDVIVDQLNRNGVEIKYAEASFIDGHRLRVKKSSGGTEELYGEAIVVATGSRPRKDEGMPEDGENIYNSDSILNLDKVPHTLTIIGGGVIACEYACVFAAIGVKVSLIDRRPRLLSFVDEELITSLMYRMRLADITLRLNEELESISVESPGRVVSKLKSGKVVISDKLLYTAGRVGNIEGLNLDAVGIKPNNWGLLTVNENFQTAVPHIYAIGDVIGFPSLASTSMEQGRRAVCHAFQKDGLTCDIAGILPFGIYTIPEISMAGETEEGLTSKGITYEVGSAFFQEVARGQITGDVNGMVKLLFDRETRRLLGVHIIGEKASELIHLGQAVLNFGGTVDYFKDTVFNYPTLSEAYKHAALNGLNKL